jgi:hypothetical protein
VERHFFLFVDFHKGEQMEEIIRGDFAKFRGLLDLAEVLGSYSASVEGF